MAVTEKTSTQVDEERVKLVNSRCSARVKCSCGSYLWIPLTRGWWEDTVCEKCGGEFYLTVEVWEKDQDQPTEDRPG